MTEAKKTVRFYEAVKLDQNNASIAIENGFWTALLERVQGREYDDRRGEFNRVTYVGEALFPTRPAMPHIQVRRVRAKSEQLDRINVETGEVRPLEFDDDDDRVAEPTYLVPFGQRNFVAVMSPAVRATSPSAIDMWLTEMCGLTLTESRIELRPIVDEAVLAKLMEARGASRLSVRVEKDSDIPPGGGVLGDAVRAASTHTTEELSLEMTWSFGHAKGSEGWRDQVLSAAQWIARSGWARSAEVSIAVEDADGAFRTEQHNIFRDRITKSAVFDVEEGARTTEETILNAIAVAIREFNQQTAVSG